MFDIQPASTYPGKYDWMGVNSGKGDLLEN